MNVSVARDGVEVGEFAREKLEALARAGKVYPTDHYWYEGMENWQLLADLLGPDVWKASHSETASSEAGEAVEELPTVVVAPPAAAPISVTRSKSKERRRGLPKTALAGVAFAVVAAIAIFSMRSQTADRKAAVPLFPARFSSPTETPAPESVRDKAIADLRERINRLPDKPSEPLQTFYYAVNVNMERTLSDKSPWTAVIRGGENVVDPASQQTLVHTDFIVVTDYTDGEWTFRAYKASVSDMTRQVTTEVEADEKAPVPPSIVSMLSLKWRR